MNRVSALLAGWMQWRLTALGPMSGRSSVPDDLGLMAVDPRDFRSIAIPTERPVLLLSKYRNER